MNTLNPFRAALLLTLGSATMSNAQVTITANDLYTIGSRYEVGMDEMPGVMPGNNGTALTWSFSTLVPDATRIVEVMAPQSSSFGDLLPGDRAAVENSGEAADHLTVAPTELVWHGRILEEDGIQAALPLDPPMVLLTLPAQHYQLHTGVTRSQRSSYLGLDLGLGFVVDSIRVRTHITYQSEVQGWGEVTTPLGTFDAIKHLLAESVTDSVDFYRADQDIWLEGVEVLANDQNTWKWWAPTMDLPVMQLMDDDADGTMDRAEWIEADLSTTSIVDRAPFDRIDVFPNPATDRITVPLEGLGMAGYVLHDAQGRLVQEGRVSRERSTIPVAHLDRGPYLLRIDQGGIVSQARVVLQ